MLEILLETRDRSIFVVHQLEGGVMESGQGAGLGKPYYQAGGRYSHNLKLG